LKKEIAVAIVDNIISSNQIINVLTELSDKLENESEAIKFRRNLAKILGVLNIDLLMPIISQYPELDPDKEFFTNKEK